MPTGTPVFWQEPTDIASRNLLLGAGGEAMKPDVSRLTFIEQKDRRLLHEVSRARRER